MLFRLHQFIQNHVAWNQVAMARRDDWYWCVVIAIIVIAIVGVIVHAIGSHTHLMICIHICIHIRIHIHVM
jgi:hypothetical protein